MSHFFGVARVEFRVESWAGAAGLLCRAAGASQPLAKKSVLQSSPHGRFYAGQVARQGGYARQAPSRTLTVPRGLAICAICAISHKATELPLSPGSLLYVLYVLYLTRQATEHPLLPGSLLYVLYVLYLTRQATEHPLSPGSLLYVLYVLFGPI